MKLGIIGAMAVEISTILDWMPDEILTTRAGMDFFEGTLENLPVVVVRCGVGKVNAAMCVQVLVDTFHVTHILNTGVAGSLDASLDIMNLLISRDAMYHDVDATVFGYAYGQVPGTKQALYCADKMLMDVAYAAAEQVKPGLNHFGRVASGDQFISDEARKQFIQEKTQASCVEMEGTAIAQAATQNKVPFVIVRAISDKADGSDIMDYPVFERKAAFRCAKVIRKAAEMLWEMEEAL